MKSDVLMRFCEIYGCFVKKKILAIRTRGTGVSTLLVVNSASVHACETLKRHIFGVTLPENQPHHLNSAKRASSSPPYRSLDTRVPLFDPKFEVNSKNKLIALF